MPTYCSLNYHLIFSTKDRTPSIAPEWMPRLHAYMGGIIRGMNGAPLEIGGVSDHVHLLVGLKPTHCVADVLRDLKKDSSSWIHKELGAKAFAWQEGYAAFTVATTAFPALRRYPQGQAEHHKGVDSRQELLDICEELGVEIEMQYFV